jgi:outer membrane receptor protein involved in Fe transport
MVQRKGLMGCVLFASTSLSTGAALAQQASAGGSANATAQSTTLEEIIVTAQKRSERLLDVPLSVTVTTGDQLAKQGDHQYGGPREGRAWIHLCAEQLRRADLHDPGHRHL